MTRSAEHENADSGDDASREPDAAPRTLDEMLMAAVARGFEEELAANPAQDPPTPEAFGARLAAVAKDALPRIVETSVEQLLALASRPEHLPRQRADRVRFRERLRAEWGAALDALEVLLHEFYAFGRRCLITEVVEGRAAADPTTQALGRLHARACRTAREVLSLLEDGLADGAFARCRTLHEVTVVARVLRAHGAPVAERYDLHWAVQTARSMRQFDRHHRAMGWEPVDPAELQAVEWRVNDLVKRFGASFRGDYGWAEGAVSRADPKRPLTLADLERVAGLEHYRPFFGWASDSVHAGRKGLQSLGAGFLSREVLYSGGSVTGLADPGQHAALSLRQFAAVLAPEPWNLDASVHIQILGELALRCQSRFIEADTAVTAKVVAEGLVDESTLDR